MYFPLAAGGLGLFNPILELTSFVPEQSVRTQGSFLEEDDVDEEADEGGESGSRGGRKGRGGRGRGGRERGSRTRAQGYRSRNRYRNEIYSGSLSTVARERHAQFDEEKKAEGKTGKSKSKPPRESWDTDPRSDAMRNVDNRLNNEISGLHSQYVSLVMPQDPSEPARLKQLYDAFMSRGTKMRGRTQESLSCYWKWLLYTYGLQLLDRLGTFNFLQTELVPLHLISHKKTHDTSL